MNIRKSFEAWFLREYGDGNFSRLESGEYADLAVRNYWGIWQGVWAVFVEQSPTVPGCVMETSKQEAQERIRQMAERLSEIDGTFSWDHQERVALNYIEQQEARIAELEQRPAVPEGWKLVPTKEKLSDLLVVGTEILVGPIYAEKHGFVEGDVLTLVEGRFEYDNGLYTEDQRAPSVWNAEEQEFYSIFHLFENDLSGFLDCEVVGAVEGALLSAQSAEQPSGAQGDPVALDDYDPGLINDHGGGDVGWWQDYIRSEVGRANDHWRAQVDVLPTQAAPLRYTSDGALAECPCCGSLDVGGAHDTVNCYGCGLTVTKPAPLQNAHDAWNKRKGKTYPSPTQQPKSQKPESIREGAPYKDPSFESLCREHEIWGTAAAAQCAVFWEAGKRAAEQLNMEAALKQARRVRNFNPDEVFEAVPVSILGGTSEVGSPERIRAGVDELSKRNRAGAAQMAGMVVGDRHPAPAVQGEPVAVFEGKRSNSPIEIWGTLTDKNKVPPKGTLLYTAPQPAEQQPDVTLLLSLLSHARCNTCDGSGGLYDNHRQPHQCQWCHDRSRALAAYRRGGEA